MNQIGKYAILYQIEIQDVYYKRDFLSEEQTTNQKWFESIPFVNPFLSCFLDANVLFLLQIFIRFLLLKSMNYNNLIHGLIMAF